MFEQLKLRKISHRFTFSVVFAITCIFLLSTVYEYRTDINEVENSIEFKLEYTADVMTVSISDPVWDYDYSGVKIIGDALFQDRDIALLVVRDHVSGELYNHEVFGEGYEREKLQVINHPIIYGNDEIGSMTLGVTKHYAMQDVYDRLILRIMELLIYVVTLTIIIFFISHQIVKPLTALEMDVKRLADGEERIKISDYKDDEIGRLAKSFNDMGDIIEETAIELHVINDSLEEKVLFRTEELMEKNDTLNKTLDTLKDTQNELIRSSKIKLTTRLVAGVAHEINTPLGLTITVATYISGKVKKIHDLSESDALTKEDVSKLTDEILDGMNSLESNLTRVTKLMEHFKQLMLENQNKNPAWFNLNEQLQEICKGLMMDLMGKNVKIDIQCSNTLEIKSYSRAFMQILSQLVNNAIQHGFNDKEEGIITVTCIDEKDQLLMTIRDNGKGMPEEVAEHIFNPFYKGDAKMNGSGLGLAIVENIVNVQLGGNIRCSSSLENGTSFEIQLPIDKR